MRTRSLLKRPMVWFIAFLTTMALIMPAGTAKAGDLVPDAALEQAIIKALGKDKEENYVLTKADLATLVVLSPGEDVNKNIQNLEGLQHATSLERLWLHGSKVSDLTPIAQLTTLKTLSLDKVTTIKDIAAVKDLVNLEVLQLDFIGHKFDLSPLANLTKLTELKLSGNKLQNEDLKKLTHLAALNQLVITENNISDFSPLGALKKLTTLVGWDQTIWAETQVGGTASDEIVLPGIIGVDGKILPAENLFNCSEVVNVTWRVDGLTYKATVTPAKGEKNPVGEVLCFVEGATEGEGLDGYGGLIWGVLSEESEDSDLPGTVVPTPPGGDDGGSDDSVKPDPEKPGDPSDGSDKPAQPKPEKPGKMPATGV